MKIDNSGSILASSPALLLKEKGVDFVADADGFLAIQIFLFFLPDARQHILKIKN